jgi:hypothetical protein
MKIGDVLTFDFQSDDFEGEYRLVEHAGGRRWVAEYVEPSDELIDRATAHYLHAAHPYLGYVDPFGPGRREATRQEALDAEILERIERTGRRFQIEFVSAARYAEAF